MIYSKIIIIILLILFYSCKKNSEFDKFELLTKSPWRLVSIIDEGEEIVDSCQMDNLYNFKEEKLYVDEGALSCYQDMKYKPAKWKFLDNGNKIKIPTVSSSNSGVSGTFVVEEFDIITLNDSIFKVKWVNFDYYKIFKR